MRQTSLWLTVAVFVLMTVATCAVNGFYTEAMAWSGWDRTGVSRILLHFIVFIVFGSLSIALYDRLMSRVDDRLQQDEDELDSINRRVG